MSRMWLALGDAGSGGASPPLPASAAGASASASSEKQRKKRRGRRTGAGTYRQNDSVDVVYQVGGRRHVASGLPLR